MGTINIVEYATLPKDENGNVLPINPKRKLASKTYTSTTSTAAADSLNGETKFLCVTAIEAHYVEADASATANSRLVPAGSITYWERTQLNFKALA
jgi:hypothetical protein